MPIGPSHGSRGGGSSFGGGSRRSGGGSKLGGAILGGIIYALFAGRRRRRYEQMNSNGENQLPYRPRPTKYLVFAIIFGIFAAFTIFIRSAFVNTMKSYQDTLDIMKTDYTQSYKPLLDKVKGLDIPAGGSSDCVDGCYKTIATFKNSSGFVSTYTSYKDNPQEVGAYLDFSEDGISYYFIVYEYKDARTGQRAKGTTYTQFSASQYQNMRGSIEIAYYSEPGQESYSINTSYTSLETPEYKNYQEVVESNKDIAGVFLIAFLVEVALVALFVFLFVKKLKKYKKLVAQDEELLLQKRQAETEKAQAEAQEAQIDAQRKNRFCQYCGSQIDEDTNTCSSCGAKFSVDN